jgi:hypothetical protein
LSILAMTFTVISDRGQSDASQNSGMSISCRRVSDGEASIYGVSLDKPKNRLCFFS